jgi:predicted kinase
MATPRPRRLSYNVRRVLAALEPLPPSVPSPTLVVLAGPPGVGKTTFARLLRERAPLAIVSVDDVRKLLFPNPEYTDAEHHRVFGVYYSTVQELLRRGVPTVADATNLWESLRRRLYRIAETAGARTVTVDFETPAMVVRLRLERRFADPIHWDRSDATWDIHVRMAADMEPVRGWHFVVDMSKDPSGALDNVAQALLPVSTGALTRPP